MRPIVSFLGDAPTKAKPGDAGYDLRADDNYLIQPGGSAVVSTDVIIAIPQNVVGLVCSRSGLAAKEGVFVLNSPGIIDPGYRGKIGVILQANGQRRAPFVVNKGDRIAQLLFVPVLDVDWQAELALSGTDRGESGFGSSGVE